MTSTILERPLEEEIIETDEDGDDDPTHISCLCSPKVAFCGIYLAGAQENIDWDDVIDDEMCKECDEINQGPCPRCGE